MGEVYHRHNVAQRNIAHLGYGRFVKELEKRIDGYV
jgi:hypothetical protein